MGRSPIGIPVYRTMKRKNKKEENTVMVRVYVSRAKKLKNLSIEQDLTIADLIEEKYEQTNIKRP